MSENIEFNKIKGAILDEERSEEYDAWLARSEKNVEMGERVRRYYEDGLSFTTTDEEVGECWREFEQKNFKKRRLMLKLTASVASIAAMVAILFFLFNTTPVEKVSVNQSVAAVVGEEVKDEVPTIQPFSGDIILKSSNGDQRVINESKIDLTSLNSSAIKTTADSVEYQTISVPKGKCINVVLSDGTVVHLNNHTEFSYPVNFVAGQPRRVFLSGEAFFEVSKDAKRRFIVSTNGVDVKVYGTKFNVNTNKSGVIETVLVEGSISAQPVGADEMMMQPNQMLTYTLSTANVKCDDVDVNNYVSWMSGIYRFSHQNLKDIMTTLSLWYDMEVIYDDEEVAKLKYICNIPRYNTFAEVMDILELCGNIGYKISGQKLHLWIVK